jgi:hypothetical protein
VSRTIVEQLADFTTEVDYRRLPEEVVVECKRILLDSLGCALGAVDQHKGKIGIEFGRLAGGADGDATIIGTADRTSIFGAAFANGELINALDFDAVLPPGHVTPYVLPQTMAVAESQQRSGRDVIAAIALSHEMSFRFYKSVDYLRDRTDTEMNLSPVLGYSNDLRRHRGYRKARGLFRRGARQRARDRGQHLSGEFDAVMARARADRDDQILAGRRPHQCLADRGLHGQARSSW